MEVNTRKRLHLHAPRLTDSCINTVLASSHNVEAHNGVDQLPLKLQLEILKKMTAELGDCNGEVLNSMISNWPRKQFRLPSLTDVQITRKEMDGAAIQKNQFIINVLLQKAAQSKASNLKTIDISSNPIFSDHLVSCNSQQTTVESFLNRQPVSFFSTLNYSKEPVDVLIDLSVYTRPCYKQQQGRIAKILKSYPRVRFLVKNLHLDQPPEHYSLTLQHVNTQHLKCLHFSEYSGTGAGVVPQTQTDCIRVFKDIGRFHKLRWLKLPSYPECSIQPELICNTLQNMKELEVFAISDPHGQYVNSLSTIFASGLVSSRLREIHLKNLKITRDTLQGICNNPACDSISTIHLEGIYGLDGAVPELCQLIRKLKYSLKHLCLSGTNISERSMNDIYETIKTSNLNNLTLPAKFQDLAAPNSSSSKLSNASSLELAMKELESTTQLQFTDEGHAYRVLNARSSLHWCMMPSK